MNIISYIYNTTSLYIQKYSSLNFFFKIVPYGLVAVLVSNILLALLLLFNMIFSGFMSQKLISFFYNVISAAFILFFMQNSIS